LGFDPLRQVLLTVGFAFLFQQAALDIWTGNPFDINPPAVLTQTIVVGGLHLPLYRIFMIGVALFIGLTLWLVMEKTRLGATIRATVDDAQMARGVGIDTSYISMLIFALGAFLAALGGVVGGAFLGVYPGLDFEMLPIAFAVVIIGGMGSLGGAAIGALIVGLADNFGKALFPEISYFTLYAPMALILAVKPTVSSTCRSGSKPNGRKNTRSITRPISATVTAATGIANSQEPVVQITDKAI
jgi:branched-chain amino acid transport system permease protein